MTRSRPPLPPPAPQRVSISRRGFLTGTGTGAAALAVAGCSTDDEGGVRGPTSTSTSAPVERARQFFTPAEASLVEALTARILPGDPDDPGAREAEVVVYIDALLASGGWGSEPVYRSGPFVTPEQIEEERAASDAEDEAAGGGGGDSSGSPDLGTTPFGVTRRPVDAFDRYGEQSMMTPPEVYRQGLPLVDAHSEARFGASFTELTEGQQDQVLVAMEDGEAPEFTDLASEDLFVLLRQHTIEGMFSDPMYGGNRDMVGWELIGWPGAQRAYSPAEMQAERPPRPPKAMEHLPAFEAGRRTGRDEPVLPQSGSDEGDHAAHGAGR